VIDGLPAGVECFFEGVLVECGCGTASITITRVCRSALSRLATTDPANPVPTTM
jgi:hypothetical protein